MCDLRATTLKSLDLTSNAEKSLVERTFSKALSKLNEIDRTLPQIIRIKALAKKGVAVHHGGMLPILKEVIEILFSAGCIKVLFATETFAIGVNMPASSVCFNGLQKHDGISFRHLLPGEYTQMSGRAGRRGLDSVGTVILLVDSPDNLPLESELRQILTGKPTKLESKFRLSYSLILKLLKFSELSVSGMMKLSFSEYNKQKKLGNVDHLTLLARTEKVLGNLNHSLESEHPKDKLRAVNAMFTAQQKLSSLMQKHKILKDLIRRNSVVVFNYSRQPKRNAFLCVGRVIELQESFSYTIQAFTTVISQKKHKSVQSIIELSDILAVYERPAKSDKQLWKLRELSIEQLLTADFLNMKIHKLQKKMDIDLATEVASYQYSLAEVKGISKDDEGDFFLYKKCLEVKIFQREMDEVRMSLSDESLELFPDFQARLEVLKQLGYVDKQTETVVLKGRCCTEIATAQELIMNQVVFENVFENLDACECAALLSSFVFQHKRVDEPSLSKNLQNAQLHVEFIANQLETIQNGCKVQLEDGWVDKNLNFTLMEVVYKWATGMPFKEICKITAVDEGIIVRTIARLDETLREVRNIAKLMGNPSLFKKMEDASVAIKRDIIFQASLYVQ